MFLIQGNIEDSMVRAQDWTRHLAKLVFGDSHFPDPLKPQVH